MARRKGRRLSHAEKRARSQMDRDNKRVPRDWANDPAWLRDLLKRTWDALPDDLSGTFRGHDETGETLKEHNARIDRLVSQVHFVLISHGLDDDAPTGGGP